MHDNESKVAEHYGDPELLSRIIRGLEASGVALDALGADDLAPVEEFHIGGRRATAYAVDRMSLDGGQHVLDIGCGIGGAARYIAANSACTVTGVDLTPEYVLIARRLTEMTGLGHKVGFELASALDMPFEDGCFDAAISLHAAMNIHDRDALYAEIARVMKPGGVFSLFDVMKKGDGPIRFPVPWAASEQTSFLRTAQETVAVLEGAGFEVHEVTDRTDFALAFFRETLAAARQGPPPLGVHLVMGASAPIKLRNTLMNIEDGRIGPVQMVARRR